MLVLVISRDRPKVVFYLWP